MQEQLSVILTCDGRLRSMELRGDLQLEISDDAPQSKLAILLRAPPPCFEGYQVKTHPNIDKTRFAAEQRLGLRDPSRAFPSQAISPMKWRLQTTDRLMLPLLVTCTLSPSSSSDGTLDVRLDYQLISGQNKLADLLVTVPLPPNASQRGQARRGSAGRLCYSRREAQLQWSVPAVKASGFSEFKIFLHRYGTEVLYPITVKFSAEGVLCGPEVDDVVSAGEDEGDRVPYSLTQTLTLESYQIVSSTKIMDCESQS